MYEWHRKTERTHQWKQFVKWVEESDNIVFFGGAGVSTESGIPDFRSTDGLYHQEYDYPPETILSHSFFMRNPEEFYRFYKNKMLCLDAKPNMAHKKLAEELEIGEITLRDIVKELEKPGRDPRDEMPKPILRTDVLDMKDLKEGMILKGTVRNVIDFGVFVDIGVHQDGLVHISEITDKKFIKHPLEVVSVGDIVDVKVMSVDLKKKRIQLTMKGIS